MTGAIRAASQREVHAALEEPIRNRLRGVAIMRRLRPAPEELAIRFETEPGQQAQVDCAHCRLPWGVRYALVVVLGCSRVLWVQFYPRQDLAHVLLGLEARPETLLPGERLFQGLDRWQVGDVHRDRLKALGLPHHRVHDARHFYTVRAGPPYELVASQLGHAYVKMVAKVQR